jgi:hypothetical protein
MQQQELQLKQAEIQRKMQKDQADLALKQQQLQVEAARIAAQKEIAGLQAGIKATHDRNALNSQMKLEGMKLGMEAARQRHERAKPMEQPAKPPKKETR